jgi:hypothetical protein
MTKCWCMCTQLAATTASAAKAGAHARALQRPLRSAVAQVGVLFSHLTCLTAGMLTHAMLSTQPERSDCLHAGYPCRLQI